MDPSSTMTTSWGRGRSGPWRKPCRPWPRRRCRVRGGSKEAAPSPRDSRIRSAALPVGAARAMEAASTPASVRAASTARTIDVLPVPGPPETTVTRRSRTRSTAWRCASFRVAGTVGVASGAGPSRAVRRDRRRSSASKARRDATRSSTRTSGAVPAGGPTTVEGASVSQAARRGPAFAASSPRAAHASVGAGIRTHVEPRDRASRTSAARSRSARRAGPSSSGTARASSPREVRLVRPEARTLGPLRQRWQPPIAPQARRPPGAAVRMPVRAHHAAAIWG
jgi:hypothetical protein